MTLGVSHLQQEHPSYHGQQCKWIWVLYFWLHMGGDKGYLRDPLMSCGYAPYIMHMIERVTTRTCYCEEDHPLRIKNDLKALVEDRRAAAGQSVSSPPRATSRRGQHRDKALSPIQKNSACSLGYASPNTPPRWRLNMRGVQEGKTPSRWRRLMLT
jgi:hypothetical protein